jgi:sugar phosphate isomerase/epimerase
MSWSFQLYSARNFQPWSDVLKILAETGYSEVEGFGGVYADPAAFRADMDRNGLTMPSGHFSIDALETDFAMVKSTASTLGMKLLVCPYLVPDQRPKDAAGYRTFGKRLAEAGKRVKGEGYEFAWHNHDFEFFKLADGSRPIDHLLEAAPDMGLEFDVAWCIRGGDVPWPIISAYGARILAVHIKDIAKPGQGLDEDGWSDVGHGTIDWKQLVATLKAETPAKHYIMEQDNPNDLVRFARRSLETVRAF